MTKRQFKSESKKLLDLMINSIYTHKEIFLREIISNASDAIDKLCYLSLTDDKVGLSRSDFKIELHMDKDSRVIRITDNGIGMSADDLEANLGVIAKSGTMNFKSEMDKNADEDMNIIGQFGVGFYSAFMVSDQVTVISRAYGEEGASKWESSGADGYTISSCERDGVGTDVIMRIKEDTSDESYSEFLDTWKLRSLVKKYSDYIRWPIIMEIERSERRETGETGEDGKPKTEFVTVSDLQTVNSMVPIWQRAKADAPDEDCINFYKEKYYDHTDPAGIIRMNAEGAVSYKALLFIPAQAPYGFYSREFEPGLQLYSNGVMIMEKCADLLPDCFRFVRGVVDSPDLSLNISRELLQHDRQLRVIASSLEKKIKSELKKLMDENRVKYKEFFENFGLQLKFGVVADFGRKKDFLSDLILFHSSTGQEPVSLEEYAKKMPASQNNIYYATGETPKLAQGLPQTERLRERGFEILYLAGEIDEFVVKALEKYEDKEFISVLSGDLGLDSEDESKALEKKEAENKELLDFIKESLGERVSLVRLSRSLVKSAACLGAEGEISFEMEKYFASIPGGKNDIKAKRVLELNPEHHAFAALKNAYSSGDRDRASRFAKVLLGTSELMAGISVEDPAALSEAMCSLF